MLETIGAFFIRVRITVRKAVAKKAREGIRVRWEGFVGEKSGTRTCGSAVGKETKVVHAKKKRKAVVENTDGRGRRVLGARPVIKLVNKVFSKAGVLGKTTIDENLFDTGFGE